MGSIGQKTLTTADIIREIVGPDSYTNTEQYRSISTASSTNFEQYKQNKDEIQRLQEQLKAESSPKPKSEWDIEDEIQAMVGNKPMKYTEKGKEIDARITELYKQNKEVEDKWSAASQRVRQMDEEQSFTQKQLFLQNPDNSLSSNVKDSYKGFKINESTTPYVDTALKEGKAFVVEMSPKRYLQEIAYNIFDRATLESSLRGTSTASVQRYMNMMKKGVKFDTPYLNYKDQQQEGRHRAIAAYLLGYKRIPVIIMRK